ncbi:fatty acid hydroxylase [Pseudomonas sp. M47T1]|uniref:beta-carotene hydroxylase n=1 Tax=Pseudomonas sp. M47T1 TaxID=1179778 RepID=UPI0002607AF9|nr:beta-carotene hydroxylase [Pseudomonas sp. M47T1]EIK97154.1 fatty acid hydroxylase [Pseudomonas sp. M47T1]
MIAHFLIFFCTLVTMEAVGTLAHKYIMHGPGWWLHRSHHEEHLGALEKNDVFLLALALAAVGLMVLGDAVVQCIGAGVAGYGLIYVFFHDGIVHRHWPVRPSPRHPYLRRLYQAHLMHHAVKGRHNSVSFGFLYAPSAATLKKQLRASRTENTDNACPEPLQQP